MVSFRAALEVPRRLRALARARESTIVVLAAFVGLVAGLAVAAMSELVSLMHHGLFAVPAGGHLSTLPSLDWRIALLVPALGGLGFGLATWGVERWRKRREVDPIEANALHGGRMSMLGSAIVALQTIWSSGVGASVGLEAGYTQVGGASGSYLGQVFRLRRADLRVLVGCGAAGAIAAAFSAPLAGAFYAFELIIGTYAVSSLAPVAVAALIGHLVTLALTPSSVGIVTAGALTVAGHDLALAGVLGLVAAGFGIGLMHAVAYTERFFTLCRIPALIRPAIGGLIVGGFATVSPQVLSSGHGVLHLAGVLQQPIGALAFLLALKAAASIVSLGAGFRGGLFFASLLLGALGGALYAAGLAALPFFELAPDVTVYAIVGLGALAVSVVGGPLTMTFIALETTGDFRLTTAVLVAVVFSSVITRDTFGYNFATWRFHLRGETIRSAADVGWLRELTVAKMMRRDVRTAFAEVSVAAFREAFPLGAATRVVLTERDGRYAGIVLLADVHAQAADGAAPVRSLARHVNTYLLPGQTVKEAAFAFDETEAEELAVLDSGEQRRVVGLLTEAHALRRYSAETERRQSELLGERR